MHGSDALLDYRRQPGMCREHLLKELMASMGEFIQELSRSFRIEDAIDICIVAVLVSGVMSWVRVRAARSIAMPLVVSVLIYWLARWLDLYLTTMIFQYGLMGAVLAFVLIFQQDIRRGFEQLAAWRWPRSRPETTGFEVVVNELVESITFLAERRIGALLVLPGDEPVDRHVRGGVSVDARFSLPLICSIFHSGSPGHDGAVTIHGERIGELGLHLPLSTDFSQVGGRGTRHAAGLGLTERCDSLVIIISEEQGSISTASDGRLQVVGIEELIAQLRSHIRGRTKKIEAQTPGNRFLKKAGQPMVAVVLAFVLWLTVVYRMETVQRTIVVPIEYRGLPEQLVVDEPGFTHAQITLRGSEQAFTALDAAKVAVSLDLNDASEGRQVYTPTSESIRNLPRELHVTDLEPNRVPVVVRRSSGQLREKNDARQ